MLWHETVTSLFSSYGYLLVFGSALLESVIFLGFIFPGSVFILLGGYFAQQKQLSFTFVLLLSWLGMFIGDLANYYLGNISQTWFKKLSKLRIFKNNQKTAMYAIKQYGSIAILSSHIIGSLRSIICFSAGSLRFSFREYIGITAFASFLWSLLFVGVGFFLGDSTASLKDLGRKTTWVSLGIILLFLLLQILKNFYAKQMGKKRES